MCLQFCHGNTTCLSKAGRFGNTVANAGCRIAFANVGCRNTRIAFAGKPKCEEAKHLFTGVACTGLATSPGQNSSNIIATHERAADV